MYFVYILQSLVNQSYYVGSCEDVIVRLQKHNHGLVPSTKRYAPWKLTYSEKYSTLKEARRRERQIKSWKKRSAIERLVRSKI